MPILGALQKRSHEPQNVLKTRTKVVKVINKVKLDIRKNFVYEFASS